MSGWSPRSHGATDQHISSSSSLSIRKPKVPFSFFCVLSNSANTECFPYFPLSLSGGQCCESNTRFCFVDLFRLRECKATEVIQCMLRTKFSEVLSKIASGLLIIRRLLGLVCCDTHMKASAQNCFVNYVILSYGSVYLSMHENISSISGSISHNSPVSFTQRGLARFGFIEI